MYFYFNEYVKAVTAYNICDENGYKPRYVRQIGPSCWSLGTKEKISDLNALGLGVLVDPNLHCNKQKQSSKY